MPKRADPKKGPRRSGLSLTRGSSRARHLPARLHQGTGRDGRRSRRLLDPRTARRLQAQGGVARRCRRRGVRRSRRERQDGQPPRADEDAALSAGEPVQYVIVHKVDRLARNRADDVVITMEIKKSGATLVSCSENIDETPSGLLLHGIMSSIAEFYSRNLATEVAKGMNQKAKAAARSTRHRLATVTCA